MSRAALVLWSLVLAANAVADPIVSFNMGKEVVPWPKYASETAVFGGTLRKLDLSIVGIDLKNTSLHVDLFQVAGRMAMPLVKTIVPGAVDLPGRALVPISFPQVKSATHVLLRLSTTNPATLVPVTLGEIRFTVFPHDLVDQIMALLPALHNGDKRLVVFGADRRLRSALGAIHVPFEDAGGDLPSQFEPARIYLGDAKTQEEQQHAQDHGLGARLAVFSVDNSLPPGMYVNRDSNEVFILVSLPILEDLANDPRSQFVLLKVIQSLTTN